MGIKLRVEHRNTIMGSRGMTPLEALSALGSEGREEKASPLRQWLGHRNSNLKINLLPIITFSLLILWE